MSNKPLFAVGDRVVLDNKKVCVVKCQPPAFGNQPLYTVYCFNDRAVHYVEEQALIMWEVKNGKTNI